LPARDSQPSTSRRTAFSVGRRRGSGSSDAASSRACALRWGSRDTGSARAAAINAAIGVSRVPRGGWPDSA